MVRVARDFAGNAPALGERRGGMGIPPYKRMGLR
jgi:hypothetical protein